MSWFKQEKKAGPTEPNFFPVTAYSSGFSKLDSSDTEWKCISNHGFQTETHTYYSLFEDGTILMCQVIWSFLGLFLVPATSQMTFKIYNPHTKEQVWKSVNVSNFKTEGRSCKSDNFEIKHTGTPETEEVYHITADLEKTIQLTLTFTKPASAPGTRYGTGASNFGHQSDDKREAFVIHRFLPFMHSTGTIIHNGKAIDAKGDGFFVHAMQSGMRPNLIASRWNFAFFSTGGGMEMSELGAVRFIQMEFETIDGYGPEGKQSKDRTKVNIGTLYIEGAPVATVGQTHPANPVYPVPNKDVSVAEHLNVFQDQDTGYMTPKGLSFALAGDRVGQVGRVEANVTLPDVASNLIEKVDVLAEIPYVLRKALAAATGTKPFIFQYHNAATLEVNLGGKVVPVKGWMYNEASFISP